MLTVPEAAARIGRNPETIRRWIREGKLPAQKIGTQHLIEPADLAEAVGGEGHRTREAPPAYGSAGSARVTTETYPNEWLPAIVGRLVRAADPIQIVVFAAPTSGGGSGDYELLVVLDEVSDRQAARAALRASFQDIDVRAAIFVASAAEVAEGRRGMGRLVYARDAIPAPTILQRLIESGRVTLPANRDSSVLPATRPATTGLTATEALLAERRADPR
jgi:excisionase family DNA binding protein